MDTYIVTLLKDGRAVQVPVKALDAYVASLDALESRPGTTGYRSVPLKELRVIEVRERHPRENWKCFHIEGWGTYKADLDVTRPRETLMVSCFDPTLFNPEDRDLFGETVLASLNTEKD